MVWAYLSLFLLVTIVISRLFCYYKVWRYGTCNTNMMFMIFLNLTALAEKIVVLLFSFIFIFQMLELNVWLKIAVSLIFATICLFAIFITTDYFVDFLEKKYRPESFYKIPIGRKIPKRKMYHSRSERKEANKKHQELRRALRDSYSPVTFE